MTLSSCREPRISFLTAGMLSVIILLAAALQSIPRSVSHQPSVNAYFMFMSGGTSYQYVHSSCPGVLPGFRSYVSGCAAAHMRSSPSRFLPRLALLVILCHPNQLGEMFHLTEPKLSKN